MKKNILSVLGFSFLALSVLGGVSHARTSLPAMVKSELQTQGIDARNFVVSVRPLEGTKLALNWQSKKSVTPASTAKVVTTLAALEMLGPHFHWTTRFETDGIVRNNTLEGNLYFVGGGDPRYVVEHLWRDAHELKARGIDHIDGDLVIDRTLFSASNNQGVFDSKARSTYNHQADAALFNFGSVLVKFTPDEKGLTARVTALPKLAGMKLQASVPLYAGTCRYWRDVLKPSVDDLLAPRFEGGLLAECGTKVYSYTAADSDRFFAEAFKAMLAEVGVTWNGRVRAHAKPEKTELLLQAESDDMATTVRWTNKLSNNLMARHLFLSLALPQKTTDITYDDARGALAQWLEKTVKVPAGAIRLDNGSGLSRTAKVTAQAMTTLIVHGYKSPRMPEWMASFPVTGMDGTMKKRPVAYGQAYIKTGLIAGVKSIAGIVQAKSGHRYAVFAAIEDPRAAKGDPVLDRVIEWIYEKG